MKTSLCNYPGIDKLGSEESINFLRVLIADLCIGKDVHTKIALIGQAIMQEAWSSVLLAPLQIDLGVQLHYFFLMVFN